MKYGLDWPRTRQAVRLHRQRLFQLSWFGLTMMGLMLTLTVGTLLRTWWFKRRRERRKLPGFIPMIWLQELLRSYVLDSRRDSVRTPLTKTLLESTGAPEPRTGHTDRSIRFSSCGSRRL